MYHRGLDKTQLEWRFPVIMVAPVKANGGWISDLSILVSE